MDSEPTRDDWTAWAEEARLVGKEACKRRVWRMRWEMRHGKRTGASLHRLACRLDAYNNQMKRHHGYYERQEVALRHWADEYPLWALPGLQCKLMEEPEKMWWASWSAIIDGRVARCSCCHESDWTDPKQTEPSRRYYTWRESSAGRMEFLGIYPTFSASRAATLDSEIAIAA